MPAWERATSTRSGARRQATSSGLPFVAQGAKVVAINPTCAMMMRREYPELLPEAQRPRARKLAAAVRDPCEFLWAIRNEPRFNTDFKSTPGVAVAYHAPCHLRAQARGLQGPRPAAQDPGRAAEDRRWSAAATTAPTP